MALEIGNGTFPDLCEACQMLTGPIEASTGRTALQRGYFDGRGFVGTLAAWDQFASWRVAVRAAVFV
jgi:hypothetical protein